MRHNAANLCGRYAAGALLLSVVGSLCGNARRERDIPRAERRDPLRGRRSGIATVFATFSGAASAQCCA